jgi:hypothetical protein
LKLVKGLILSEIDDYRNEALSFLILCWFSLASSGWRSAGIFPPEIPLAPIRRRPAGHPDASLPNKNPRVTGLFISEGLTLILLGTIYSGGASSWVSFIPIAVFAGFMLNMPALILTTLLASLGLVAVVLPFIDQAAFIQVLTGPVVCSVAQPGHFAHLPAFQPASAARCPRRLV